MAQVIWTTQATLELAEAVHYFKTFSKAYADKLARKLYERSGQLANFPQMGRIIPEIGNPSQRELIEGNYRIMYQLLDVDIILVQRVIHQSQDFRP